MVQCLHQKKCPPSRNHFLKKVKLYISNSENILGAFWTGQRKGEAQIRNANKRPEIPSITEIGNSGDKWTRPLSTYYSYRLQLTAQKSQKPFRNHCCQLPVPVSVPHCYLRAYVSVPFIGLCFRKLNLSNKWSGPLPIENFKTIRAI